MPSRGSDTDRSCWDLTASLISRDSGHLGIRGFPFQEQAVCPQPSGTPVVNRGKPGNCAGCLCPVDSLDLWHITVVVTSQELTLAVGRLRSLPGVPRMHRCGCRSHSRPASLYVPYVLSGSCLSSVFFILQLLVPASQLLPSAFSLSVFVFFPGRFVHLSAAVSAGPRVELAFSLLSLLISTSSLFSERDCCRCSLNNTLFSFQGSVSSCCERVDARRCVSVSSALGVVEWGWASLFLDMFLTLPHT